MKTTQKKGRKKTPPVSQRMAKLQATDDSQLSKSALWQKYHYEEGAICDIRAVLK